MLLQSGGLSFPSAISELFSGFDPGLWPESLIPIFLVTLRCCGHTAGSEAHRHPALLGAAWTTAHGLSVLLACDTRCVFSNTNWSCLQMPSKSQNSPNLLNFVNSIQPTPVTIAACLRALQRYNSERGEE